MLPFQRAPGDAHTGGPWPTSCASGFKSLSLYWSRGRGCACQGEQATRVLPRNFLAGGPEEGPGPARGVDRTGPALEVWLGSACRGPKPEEVTVRHLRRGQCWTGRSPVLGAAEAALPRCCHHKGCWCQRSVHVAVFSTILVEGGKGPVMELLSQNTSSDWLQSLQIPLY